MRRRFLKALLWLCLLPLVGFGRLLWSTLLLLPRLRLQALLILVGLIVALSLPGPVATMLRSLWVGPIGQMIQLRGAEALSVLVLWFGLRTRWLRRMLRRSWWSVT